MKPELKLSRWNTLIEFLEKLSPEKFDITAFVYDDGRRCAIGWMMEIFPDFKPKPGLYFANAAEYLDYNTFVYTKLFSMYSGAKLYPNGRETTPQEVACVLRRFVDGGYTLD